MSTRPLSAVLTALLLLATVTASAQEGGSVVGWGREIVVPPHELHGIVKQVEGEHVLALRADGVIVAWGDNVWGTCDVPEPNADFIDIAIVPDGSYGLKEDGSVVYWGYEPYGVELLPEPNTGFASITAAREAVFAQRPDGSLVGFGILYDRDPVPEPNIGFTSFGIGNNFVVAVRSDSSVEVWGEPGRLDGWLPPEPNTGFVKVVAGANHWVGLRDDGTIAHVGYRPEGSPLYGDIPVPNEGFLDVATFFSATWVLNSDRTVTGWETRYLNLLEGPQPNQDFTSILGFDFFGIANRLDGTSEYWGTLPDLPDNGPAPNLRVADVSLTLATFGAEGLVLFEDGTLDAWGRPDYAPSSANPFVAIDSGDDFHLALDSAGQVHDFYWQDNDIPDFGTGPDNRIIAISAGWKHRLALKQNGDVIAWGSNYNGQCDVPLLAAPAVAIAAGGKHSVALLADGSIVGWGENYHGQADDKPANWGPDFISAGFDHTVGLTPGGTLVGWGNNGEGQLDFPYPNGNWIEVQAGNGCTLGRRSDGTVVAWGQNYNASQTIAGEETEILAYATSRQRTAVVLALPTATGVADPLTPSRVVRILGVRPNPFNPSTAIEFVVPAGQPMVLEAFDVRGRLVEALLEDIGTGVPVSYVWRPEGQASGVYFLRVRSGESIAVTKALLLK